MGFENPSLAGVIAGEWDAQTDTKKGIQPPTMPLMSLASTAIDQIKFDPESVKKLCLSYLPTDTALFWAPNEERILLSRQRDAFQPLLTWLTESYSINLTTVSEGVPTKIKHSEASTMKIAWLLNQLVSFEF